MSAKGVFVFLSALGFAAALSSAAFTADGCGTISQGLIKAPRPETLPAGAAVLDVSGRYIISEPDLPGDTLTWGPDLMARVGILEMAEIGVGITSRDKSMQFAAGQLRLNLKKECNNWPAIGAGVLDMTSEPHPGPDDVMPATNSDEYLTTYKNFSLYGVLAKGLWTWGRAYAGFGSGRFKSEAGCSKYLHGLFGGGELYLGPIRAIAECDGRCVNAGLGTTLKGGNIGNATALIDLIIAGRYLQHIRSGAWDIDMRPALAGMLTIGLTPSKAGSE